jgi:hypothetical protein
MPHWLIKSATHRVISWLPRRQFWNGLLQSYITKSTELTPKVFEDKVRECQRHLEAMALGEARRQQTGFTVLELGTGWLPIITVGLHLCGAREIWSVDIDPLLRKDRVRQLVELFRDYGQSGKLHSLLPAVSSERLHGLASLIPFTGLEEPAAFLGRLNIHILIQDARHLPLPEHSIDFFESSGVLEYIPPPVLHGIFREFHRLASPGAAMSHRLNLVDQFSYFDSSLTPFNFLKYSAAQWRWLNSPLIWQNRLRISDYRRLLDETGFELCREESVSGSPVDLAKVKLAAEFEGYSEADLLVLHSFLTARDRPAAESHLQHPEPE